MSTVRSSVDILRDLTAAMWDGLGKGKQAPRRADPRTPYELDRDAYLENLAEERANPDANLDGYEADEAADRAERLADRAADR